MTPQESLELSGEELRELCRKEELRELCRKGLVEIGVKGEPGEPGITRELPDEE